MDQIVRKSKDFFAKWNRKLGIALVALVVLLVVVFVPMLIYSKGNADVLSYYGSILGAVVTAGSLFITIRFTKRQIYHDLFLERNNAFWKQIEEVTTKALIDISPLNMVSFEGLDPSRNDSLHAQNLYIQEYILKTKTSMDTLVLHMNPVEYERIKPLINEMETAVNEFCAIANKLSDEHAVIAYNPSVSNEQLQSHDKRVKEIYSEIIVARDGTYQRLLNMKRDVFRQIYDGIDIQAQQMLLFKRRPPHANS